MKILWNFDRFLENYLEETLGFFEEMLGPKASEDENIENMWERRIKEDSTASTPVSAESP